MEKQSFCFMQDDSCHWYLIPFKKADDFSILSDKICNTNEDSDEYYKLTEAFNKEFSQYRSKSPHGMRVIIP